MIPIKFSIVTATYNAATCIEPTLQSVLQQTYPHIQHIIIDGASTDNTLKLVNKYIQQNEKKESTIEIVCQSEHDKGIYDAMNKGLQKATGDYTIFLNAGDSLYSSDTLLLVADKIAQSVSRPAVVYGDTHLVNNKRIFIRRRRLTPPIHLTWKSFKQGMLVCHQSFYVRSDIAKRYPYNMTYRLSADFDWCIRIMKYAEKNKLILLNTQQVLTNYLSEGATTRHHKESLQERRRIMQHHYGWATTLLLHIYFVLRHIIRP